MRGFKTCKIIYVGCLVIASCFAFFNNTASSALAAQIFYEIVDSDSTTIHFVLDGVPFDFKKVEGGDVNLGVLGKCHLETYWIMETELTYELFEKMKNPNYPTNSYNHFAWNRMLYDSKEVFYIRNEDYNVRPILFPWDADGWSLGGGGVSKPYLYYSTVCQSGVEYLDSIFPRFKFALPSVRQWVFAARGGKSTNNFIYSGSDDLEEVAWTFDRIHNTGASRPQPVKQKKANELGLYDMSGNAAEIVSDYIETYSFHNYYDDNDEAYTEMKIESDFIFCGGDVDSYYDFQPSLPKYVVAPQFRTIRLVLTFK